MRESRRFIFFEGGEIIFVMQGRSVWSGRELELVDICVWGMHEVAEFTNINQLVLPYNAEKRFTVNQSTSKSRNNRNVDDETQLSLRN